VQKAHNSWTANWE